MDEYRAMREMKLRQSTAESDALVDRVRRVTGETDGRIRMLEYVRGREGGWGWEVGGREGMGRKDRRG